MRLSWGEGAQAGAVPLLIGIRSGGGCTWFGRGEWGGSCVIVYICIGEAGRWKGEMSSI